MFEKLQTLLLILFGLIVFVVSMWRKAQEAMRREAQERKLPQPDSRSTARPVVRPPGAPSFEELLQQMKQQNQQGNSKPQQGSTPTPASRNEQRAPAPRTLEVPQPSVRNLEEAATTRTARSLEEPTTAPRRAASLPRAAASLADNYWAREARPSQRPTAAADIAARLRNPADLRAAFIMAEVLQRRFE
ncbi:hypothetical protein [Solirubrum puertoriconensis]|uniref:Uncharacterized protein n=1 Tax=Solirubrum puertoriconensis TaxID=1751427 RepID=A0A9X0HMY1_SOLP1|nr:hypothetical protein [Solirubrum puertoriconensis]KUG08804.1 hypothetical protein ASU33_11790 [Solirubrum puertoriconensis]